MGLFGEVKVISDQIDWSFNFESESGRGRSPNIIREDIARLKEIERRFKSEIKTDITDDGGIPRVGWDMVIGLGMVSQWPYFTSRPCVEAVGYWGHKWYDWSSITDFQDHDGCPECGVPYGMTRECLNQSCQEGRK